MRLVVRHEMRDIPLTNSIESVDSADQAFSLKGDQVCHLRQALRSPVVFGLTFKEVTANIYERSVVFDDLFYVVGIHNKNVEQGGDGNGN